MNPPVPLSLEDALTLPLLVGDIGTPLIGRSLLGAIDADDHPETLAQAIAAQRAAFEAADPSAALAGVESGLERLGATPPSRPTDAATYLAWSDAVIGLIASRTSPARPEGAVAALARTYADFVQALALLIVMARLRAVAPDAPRLEAQERSLTARAADCARRLGNVTTLPSLPPAAMAIARRMAATTTLALRLDGVDAATRQAALKLLFERLGKELAELRAALAVLA